MRRLDVWNDWVSDRLVSCVVDAKKDFVASFKTVQFGATALVVVEGDAAKLSILPTADGSVASARYILVRNQNCIGKYSFNKRSELLSDDSFMLLDLSKKLTVDIPTDSKIISMVCLKEAELPTQDSIIEQAIGKKINLTNGSGAVLNCFLDNVLNGAGIAPEKGNNLLLDLVDLALYDAVKTSNQEISNRRRSATDVINFIKQNFNDSNLTTKQIADRFGASERHVQLIFSDLNTTPTRFMRDLRLAAVARQLVKSNLSITELAFDAGFNDYSQFCAQFKAKYALSPSNYRNQHRQ